MADELSFRRAALRCAVSQPSLSAQLAELERGLGVALFERDRRRVMLTAPGAALVELARGIVRDAKDLVELARRTGDPLAGTLRVGVIPTISPYLLPRIAAALHLAHPELGVRWVEDKTEVLVASLERGDLDAALVALEAELGSVDHEVIGADPFVLATAVGHPLGASSTPVHPNELRRADVLLLDDGHCFRSQALEVCTRNKARELEFRATSLSTLAQMVADGAAVTLLPELAVATEAKRADLVIRRFAAPAPKRTIALVWRRRSSLTGALRRLAETLRTAYRHTVPEPAEKAVRGGRARTGTSATRRP